MLGAHLQAWQQAVKLQACQVLSWPHRSHTYPTKVLTTTHTQWHGRIPEKETTHCWGGGYFLQVWACKFLAGKCRGSLALCSYRKDVEKEVVKRQEG